MIIHWDCLEEMDKLIEQGIKVDLILTDPPYDIKNTKAWGKSKLAKSMQWMNDELKETWLNINLWIEWCKRVPLLQKKINCYIWCNKSQIPQYLNYFLDLWCSFDIICWRKTNAMPTFNNKYLSDKEYCLYFRKWWYCNPWSYIEAKTIFEQPINSKDKKQYNHPTIKPLNIIEIIIKNSTKENETVLDCFAWSWTTWLASKNLNRNYILIEKELEYIEIIKERLK
jgi:site-specific DNA-methyltransferase (adenine-specific)